MVSFVTLYILFYALNLRHNSEKVPTGFTRLPKTFMTQNFREETLIPDKSLGGRIPPSETPKLPKATPDPQSLPVGWGWEGTQIIRKKKVSIPRDRMVT